MSGGGRTTPRRGRVRRAGEGTVGLLLVGQRVLLAALAVLVLVAGGWTSWTPATRALQDGGRGTLVVRGCERESCRGTFASAGAGGERAAWIASSTVRGAGSHVEARPVGGGAAVVRTGLPGVLHAVTPVGGALLLAAAVLWGGVRMRRTAAALAAAGLAVLVGAFAAM